VLKELLIYPDHFKTVVIHVSFTLLKTQRFNGNPAKFSSRAWQNLNLEHLSVYTIYKLISVLNLVAYEPSELILFLV